MVTNPGSLHNEEKIVLADLDRIPYSLGHQFFDEALEGHN
jgi:hypothetical protein